MISVLAETLESQILIDVPLEDLQRSDFKWYWVNIECPSADEVELLRTYFKFNPLAIEDCLEGLERPKVDYYETYNFFILHAINQNSKEPVELDLFVSEKYIVSFCKEKLEAIESIYQKILNQDNKTPLNPTFITYLVIDKIIDLYFPVIYQLEDALNEINKKEIRKEFDNTIDTIFKIRTELLALRYIVNSMKELLYRIINSEHLAFSKKYKHNFNDIYDHLLLIYDTIESNRELTADMRDNYLSINSNRMNKIMTFLTIITSIFIPLTFIAGVYGMNFNYMPELRWKFGYYLILGIMFFTSISMILWFKIKGWFKSLIK